MSLVSAIEGEADNVIKKHNFQNCVAHTFDCVGDKVNLEKMIKSHDLVISLLPYIFHPQGIFNLYVGNKSNPRIFKYFILQFSGGNSHIE